MFNVIKGDHAEQHYYRHDDEQRAFIMMTISRVGRARANSGVGEQAREQALGVGEQARGVGEQAREQARGVGEQARGGKQPPLPPLPHSLPGKS